jgi:tRNA (mo5U34)-methyltransferase
MGAFIVLRLSGKIQMTHIDFTPSSNLLRFVDNFAAGSGTDALTPFLAGFAENGFDSARNGNLPRWLAALNELPEVDFQTEIVLDSPSPSVSPLDSSVPAEFAERLEKALRKLHPWRKGPFSLFGVDIDAEWRSNLKWGRLRGKISDLKGRLVLDVGCGNGYYGLRMLGEGAKTVVGVDTGLGAAIQFQALNKYFKSADIVVFPASVDDLPDSLELFDTVFSMGLLYHRKNPTAHLERLRSFLKPGGECVLESIVIDGSADECLIPSGRYAQMRNVHQIPSVKLLEKWLKNSGFINPRLLDVSITTTYEQRSTSWMKFNSLQDFLDPKNHEKTVEGHPAPKRAVFTATK